MLYEQKIRVIVDAPENRGKVLVINVHTGEYEMDEDVAAAKRANARFGNAALFAMRIRFRQRTGLAGAFWQTAYDNRRYHRRP